MCVHVWQLREASRKDRAVVEKGVRAFVSFVRGYKEHHCNYIFRFQELEMGAVAMSYGVLKIPRMPETRHHPRLFDGFEPDKTVDVAALKYKDKNREKQRQQFLKQQLGGSENPQNKPGRQQRQQQGKDQAGKGNTPRVDVASLKSVGARAVRRAREEDEQDEMNREYKELMNMRKRKKGKKRLALGDQDDDLDGLVGDLPIRSVDGSNERLGSQDRGDGGQGDEKVDALPGVPNAAAAADDAANGGETAAVVAPGVDAVDDKDMHSSGHLNVSKHGAAVGNTDGRKMGDARKGKGRAVAALKHKGSNGSTMKQIGSARQAAWMLLRKKKRVAAAKSRAKDARHPEVS
ncbi:unnamed protein product [Closterium sp. NIES-54]